MSDPERPGAMTFVVAGCVFVIIWAGCTALMAWIGLGDARDLAEYHGEPIPSYASMLVPSIFPGLFVAVFLAILVIAWAAFGD